jgi:hypothetical protein
LPLAKMSAVVLGSRMRIMTAAKRLGLYCSMSELRDHKRLRAETPSATILSLERTARPVSRSTRTSALRACSAIVFRSRRQSRLTVATMFLSGSAQSHISAGTRGVCLLERGSYATRPSIASSRRRSGGRGSHPRTVRGLDALLLNAVGRLPVSLRGGIRNLIRASWERQRARRSEGLGLRRVRRVGLDIIHFVE